MPHSFATTENIARAAFALILLVAGSIFMAAAHAGGAEIPRFVFIALCIGAFACALWLVAGVIAWAGSASEASTAGDRTHANRMQRGWLAFVALALFSYTAVYMSSSGFGFDDEIYSWNFWAIQHTLREAYDISNTRAPYPQAYALWIASVYLAQGGVEAQWLARAVSSTPALLVAAAPLALVREALTFRRFAWIAFAQLAVALFIWQDLRLGYADPAMTAFIAWSLVFLLLFHRDDQSLWLLIASVACAILAANTKQAAIPWGGLALPILLCASSAVRSRLGWWVAPLAAACMLGSLAWVLFVAPGFTSNRGVIDRSLGERGMLGTFFWSLKRYFLLKPALLLVLIAAFVKSWRKPLLLRVLVLGVLPMMVLWFIFGSYQMRLGIHVLVMLQLVLCAGVLSGGAPPSPQARINTRIDPRIDPRIDNPDLPLFRRAIPSLAIALALFAVLGAFVAHRAERQGFDLDDGRPWVFRKNYGEGVDDVFALMLRDRPTVWADNGLAYGPLFPSVPLLRPKDHPEVRDALTLRKLLLSTGARYAVTGESARISPPWLVDLARACPDAFQRRSGQGAEWTQLIFRIDGQALSACDSKAEGS